MSLNLLRQYLDDPALQQVEQIQSLWSGYGDISRYYSPRLGRSIIVKAIKPPAENAHPRGWNGAAGHTRKLKSYRVEGHFYQHYAQQCQTSCRVPALIGTIGDDYPLLLLEDLDAAGYALRRKQASLADVQAGVRWLAAFHGRFMGRPAKGLWQQGCYWHLATRQQEWQSMVEGGLKHAANALDARLSGASYQTLVHGDAKLANMCFSDGQVKVAMVDFQYTGAGVGVTDLAYFLGSALTSEALFDHEAALLSLYFTELKVALGRAGWGQHSRDIESQWRALYAIAWADFHRFLAGWAPEHGKINPYMQAKTAEALALLRP